MKKINLLYLILLATPSLSFTSLNDEESFFSITSFEVEFSEDNKTITVSNKYTSSVTNTGYYCDISWYINKDGKEEYLESTRLKNFKKVSNADVPNKPIIDVATLGEENEIVIYVTPCDTKKKVRDYLRLNLKGKLSVTFSEKDNDVGVSSGYIVESRSFDESKSFIKEDRLIFSNYEDLIVEDYYLDFDIRRFNYLFTGNNNSLEGEFYFLIYDKYNLFKDLPIYKDSQYRYIKLKPCASNANSCFVFKDNIFYDPSTHNVSTVYKDGYKETEKLYFPIGQLDKLKSIHCMLSFDINGYTNFNMSSTFDIYFLKNYFGDCLDSDYCIEMNHDDGSNIREKVVDVNL